MKIEEFIKGFKETNDKEEYVKKHIVTEYIPYEKKIALCQNVIEKCNFVNNKFYQNSPMQYMYFSLSIMNEYTDIEIPFGDGKECLSVFNLLDEQNLISAFMALMPKNEYTKMNTILNMCMDDMSENQRSIYAFFDTKLQLFETLLDGLEKAVDKV